MQKKGQSVGIDFSVGLFVMLLIIGISINYISNSVSTKSSFSEPIKNAAYSTINKLTRNLQWIVYQMPILVETNHSLTNQKLGFYFNFSKVDVNSVNLPTRKTQIWIILVLFHLLIAHSQKASLHILLKFFQKQK